MDPREGLIAEIERLQRQIQDALEFVRRLREKALGGGGKPVGQAEEVSGEDEPPRSLSNGLSEARGSSCAEAC